MHGNFARLAKVGASTLAILLSVACSSADVTPPGETGPPKPGVVNRKTYRLRAQQNVGQSLGAILVTASGFEGTPRVLVSNASVLRTNTIGTEWRILVIGRVEGVDLVEFTTGGDVAAPVVALTDASTSSAQNYRRLTASEVQLSMSLVPQ